MNMPGFTAQSSLGPTMDIYRGQVVSGSFPSHASRGVTPQLGFGGIRIWASTGDAGRMGAAISSAVFLADFLPSQSVAF